MNAIASANDIVIRAFNLAYFIHADKSAALGTVTSALDKLEVAVAAQDNLLYYCPPIRPFRSGLRPPGSRTKVTLDEIHLLQRLIYLESEPYEKLKERSQIPVPLTEEDMVVHFVKHLVSITIRRNSFHVSLG